MNYFEQITTFEKLHRFKRIFDVLHISRYLLPDYTAMNFSLPFKYLPDKILAMTTERRLLKKSRHEFMIFHFVDIFLT